MRVPHRVSLGCVCFAWMAAGCSGSTPAVDAGSSDDSGSLVDAGVDGGQGTDAGVTQDSGTDSGSPITAPDDQWTWVDFPTSRCASGTPTGLAVNPHAGATELMIYFEGGGSCYSAATCWGPNPSARNLAGYDAGTFASAPQRNYPTLVRTQAGNPFAAMNLVYVPYCTGDLHAGTQLASLTLPDGGVMPTYFYGAVDLDLFLQRLVPTFPSTTRVVMLGTSAGGFATYLDLGHIVQAFGVPVDIVDDSGPPLVRDGGTNNAGLFSTWGVVPPANCAGCNSLEEVLDAGLQLQTPFSPPGRYGFLSFTQDTVISVDFGYTLAEYPAEMTAFSASLPPSPAAATYLVAGEQSHVVESDPQLAVDYLPWLTQLVTGSASWADVCFNVDGGATCP